MRLGANWLKLFGATVFLGVAAAHPPGARAQAPLTIMNGAGGTGFIVTPDTSLSTNNSNTLGSSTTIGNSSTQTIYENYSTVGGAGSGGGAGLGGAFFVDQGASLTLNNVSFNNNTATGGQGGGVRVDSVAAAAFSVTSTKVDASTFQAYGTTVTGTYNSGNQSYAVSGLTLPQPVQVVGVGSGVSIGTGSYLSTIGSTTSNANGSETLNINSGLTLTAGNGLDVVTASTSNGTTSFQLSSNSSSSVLSGMSIVGSNIPAGVVVNKVSYDSNGNVTSFTANDSSGNAYTLPTSGSFAVVDTQSFGISKLAITNSQGNQYSNVLTSTGALAGFSVGMTVSGTGVPAGTTVTGVTLSTDPNTGNPISTVTVSQPVNLATATNLTASFNPIISNNSSGAVIEVQSTRGLAVGQTIGGLGVTTGTTITAINGNQVTLSQALGSAAVSQVSSGALELTVSGVTGVTSNTVSVSSVSGFRVGDALDGDSRIPANAQITAINTTTNTLTFTINPALERVNTGGSMNNLKAPGGTAASGTAGQTGTSYFATLDNGEGAIGGNGSAGSNGTNGAGGNGGNGGSGSNASATNKTLAVATALDVTAVAADVASLLGDATPFTFTKNGGDVLHLLADIAHSVFDIVQVAGWQSAELQGLVALGGNGGSGGNGGNGSDFFGGGKGGNGGNGGNGAASNAIGGIAGTPGAGGTGGFGAGGGSGGVAGQPGANGTVVPNGFGGAAGFGGGTGSVGGSLGQGGSGYGGAVFVRNGGTLTITGNSVFQNNSVLPGGSSNGGASGQAAGADLFMMTGSFVTLAPGRGNTITFYDSIADDSSASIGGSSIAAGTGASLHITGGGTVQFFGTNTYSGTTYIGGATLEAQDGTGINPSSQVQFNGTGSIGNGLSFNSAGVLLSGGTFSRAAGTAPVNVNWTGSGGFAATSAGLTINLAPINGGTGPTLTWNAGGFVPTGSTLIFGSDATDATGTVTFQNAINLNGQAGQVAVYHNSGNTASYDAVLAGAVTNGSLTVNDTGYTGTLLMPAQNSLSALTLNNGTLSTVQGTQIGRLFDPVNGGALTINGGTLILGGAEKLTTASVASGGILETSGPISATAITNSGIQVYGGALNATSIDNFNSFTVAGPTTVTGSVINETGATFFQGGTLSAASVTNNGTWSLDPDMTVTGTVTNNGTMTVIGTLTGTSPNYTETAATRTITAAGFAGASTGVVNLGGLSGNVTNTLVLNLSGTSTYAGIFTGAGGLTKDGAGYLTLTGASTFTGPLTVTNGTLDTTGGGTFAATVNATVGVNGTFIVGTGDTIASLTNSGTTTVNAALSLATATNNQGGTVTVNASLTSTGAVSNAGTLSFAGGSNGTIGGALTNTGSLTSAGTLSVSGLFTNAANATATLGSAGSSTFAGVANSGTLTASSPFTVTGTLTNDAAGAVTWYQGSAPDLGNLTNSGTLVANDALTIQGAYTQNAGSLTVNYNASNGPVSLNTGSLSGAGGSVVLNGGSWAITQTANGTYDGTVSGTGTVTKYGSAALFLAGSAGSFAPSAATVDQGVLTVVNANILGSSLPVTTDAAGTLNLMASQAFASLTNNGTTNLAADMTTSGSVTNNNLINVIGTLTGTSPNFTETAATRTINAVGFTGASTGVVNLGGLSGTVADTLVLNLSGTSTYAGTFTGAGGLTKDGAGYLTLTGASTFTGPLTVTNGTLDTTGGGTFAAATNATVGANGTFIVGTSDTISSLTNSGTTTVNAALSLATATNNQGGTVTVNTSLTSTGAVSNAGTLSFAGGAAGTFGGALTNTGSLTSAGTLSVSGLFTNAANATATLGSAGSSTFAGVANSGTLNTSSPFTVTGNLTNSAGGSVTLNAGSRPSLGSLTNSGAMTANTGLTVQGAYAQNGGSLTANASLATGSLSGAGGSISINNGSTYSLNQTANGTYSGSISGTGSVLKMGSANLTIAGGADSFSPASLTIAGGQVIITGANALDRSLTVSVNSGSGLVLDASQTINRLSGSGTLDLNNSNLTLADGGLFNGSITGNGGLNVTSGSLQLTSSINSGSGVVQVSSGSTVTVTTSSSLTATVLDVSGGTLYVSGTATAPATTIRNGGTLILGNGTDLWEQGATSGTVTSGTVTVASGSTLTGNGTINGTVEAFGTVHPGNSPGIMNVTNLVFNSGSTAQMSLDGIAGPGANGGYSQFVISGSLTLLPGSSLVISKSTAAATELTLGQQAQLFAFSPGAVSGYFGSVSATGYTNGLLFNVPTGSVIGLGSYTPASFVSAVANTPNEKALMNALLVNTAGGVPQYAGGNLLGYVTRALASGTPGAVDAAFGRWSPEGYGAILNQTELSVLQNLRDLSSYDTLVPGRAYVFGGAAANGTISEGSSGYTQSHLTDTAFTAGFAYQLPFAELSVWYGGSLGSYSSSFMQGSVDSNQLFFGASVPVTPDQQLRITGVVGFGEGHAYGRRTTNSGTAGFNDVGTSDVAYGIGLAYHRPGDIQVDLSGQLLGVSESLDSFGERSNGTATGAGALDLLTVGSNSQSPLIGQLHARLSQQVFRDFDAFIGLTYEHEMGAQYTRINGRVTLDSVGFGVENPGLVRDRVAAETGFRFTVIPNLELNATAQAGNASTYRVGGGLRYTF